MYDLSYVAICILLHVFLFDRPDRIDAARDFLATEIMHDGYEDDPEDEAVRFEILLQVFFLA